MEEEKRGVETEMMISARYRKSEKFPDEKWIEIKGLGEGITGINIGQAYSLRDALNACLNEWEKEIKGEGK